MTNDHRPHNANNLEEVWFLHDSEALSERFLARPECLGHGFVDDGNSRSVFTIEVREVTAADEGNTHSLEVAGGDVVKIYESSAVIRVGLFAFAKDST